MRTLIYLVFVFVSVTVNAQSYHDWLAVSLSNDIKDRKPTEVINVLDDSSNNFASFIKYSNFLDAHLFNENKELVSKLRFNSVPKYFQNYIGCSKNGLHYTLFFKNESGKKFSAITFNFESRDFEVKDNIGIKFQKEVFIESFEANDAVFVLSTIKKTSKLKLYKLNFDGNFTVRELDFSSEEFKKPNGLKTTLSSVIRGIKTPSVTNSVKSGEPSSLEITSVKNKIYFIDNVIYLSFNCFDNYTGIVTINLVNDAHDYIQVDNPNFVKKERGNKSNSFIYENYLFAMYVTGERLVYDIYDLQSLKIIKTLKIDRKKPITFKNSPIILEGGEFKNYRELERTNQFLRKVSNSKVGTFVYKNKDRFVITIGSSEPKETPQMFYYGGGLVGGIVTGVANSILASAYQSYANTRSTRIECFFDADFNHIERKIPLNGFDRIERYFKQKGIKRPEIQTLFKHNGSYVFGYLDKTSNSYKYIIIKS